MNKLVKQIIATACSGFIVGLVFFGVKSNNTTNTSCDYPGFASLKEMTDASNLIVNGIIVSDNGISLIDAGAGEMKYRTYDLKVTKCIKGNAVQDESIPIKILETTTDNIDNLLEAGKEYICFLETYYNGIPASLINMEQSTIHVKDNDLIVSDAEKNIIQKSLDKSLKMTKEDKQSNKIYDSKDELINKIKNFGD